MQLKPERSRVSLGGAPRATYLLVGRQINAGASVPIRAICVWTLRKVCAVRIRVSDKAGGSASRVRLTLKIKKGSVLLLECGGEKGEKCEDSVGIPIPDSTFEYI